MKHEAITHKIIFRSIFINRALEKEFKLQHVPFESEHEIKIFYKGDQIGLRKVDFLVDKQIPVEIKAINEFHDLKD